MNREEIVQRVNQTLHDGFEIPTDQLKPEATLFGDLQLDSLDAIDMLVHLEEKLSIKVESELFKEVRTLNDVYNLVENIQRPV